MRLLLILVVLLVATPVLALDPPKTEEQKTLYAVGTSVYRSLSVFNLSQSEFERVLQGLQDAQAGKKPDFDPLT